ncbi:MAG: hypothetical protein NXI31_26300 [bacterium]|nr:hypothetical protein [bacterium]
MRVARMSFALLATTCGTAHAHAQAPAAEPEQPGAVAADGLPLIARAVQGRTITAMRSFSQGLATDGQGRIWCMVAEHDDSEPEDRELWLHVSADRGTSWRRVPGSRALRSYYGALAGEPDSSVLHVVRCSRLGQEKYSSAVYQRFDTNKGAWLDEPEVLRRGNGDQDQFGVSDLAIGADGTVATLVTTHRAPKRPPWPSGWSSGLFVHSPDAAAWQGPFPINVATYGVWANLQLLDGRAHTTYRTSPSHSMIGYRSFALADQKFEQPKDVEISVRPASGRFVSNASSLLIDPFGGITVLYPAAGRKNGKGQILLARSEDGKRWQSSVLAEDPELHAGNLAHEHMALVRGPGRQAIALYSKQTEDHRVLYRRIIDGGRIMEAERELARSKLAGAYTRISTLRDPRCSSGVWAAVSGRDEGQALGVRAIRAKRAQPVRWR